MQFCKEDHALIKEGEGTGMIINAEPDNEMKYQEDRQCK